MNVKLVRLLRSSILKINQYLTWFDEYNIKPSSHILLMLLSNQLSIYLNQLGDLLNLEEAALIQSLISPETRGIAIEQVLSGHAFPEMATILQGDPCVNSYFNIAMCHEAPLEQPLPVLWNNLLEQIALKITQRKEQCAVVNDKGVLQACFTQLSQLLLQTSPSASVQTFLNILPEQLETLTLADWTRKTKACLKLYQLGSEWTQPLERHILGSESFQAMNDQEDRERFARIVMEHSSGPRIRNDFLRELITIKNIQRQRTDESFHCEVFSTMELICSMQNPPDFNTRHQFIVYHNTHYNAIDVMYEPHGVTKVLIMDAAADSARDTLANTLKTYFPQARIICLGNIDRSTPIQNSNDACGFFSFDHLCAATKQKSLYTDLHQLPSQQDNGITYIAWGDLNADFLRHTESMRLLENVMKNRPVLASQEIETLPFNQYLHLHSETNQEGKVRNNSMKDFRQKCLDSILRVSGSSSPSPLSSGSSSPTAPSISP